MTLFAVTFLLIYTLMHLMVWLGVRPLVPAGRRVRAGFATLAGVMIAAPILTRLLERADLDLAARAMAWIGYLWMGFLWLAFALFTAQGAWNGVIRLAGRYRPALRGWVLAGRRPALFALIAVLGAGTWAFFEAADLRVERVTLQVAKLPPGLPRLRIVQVSDLHLGLINREAVLDRVIETIRPLRPDLLVVTGDLLDAQRNHLEGLSAPWLRLAPPLGKFAVVGNHEAYAGRDNALDYLRAAGFRTLTNELVTVGGLQIAGVPDPAWGEQQGDARALAAADPNLPVIFLKHRPWVDREATDRFTLQLSGHAHRGQLFPFNLVTGLAYPLQDGLYRLDGDSWLYTSRGTGSWGPPMRLLSPPELTLIELEPAAGASP
ncbi:MAG: metallophosphoesterase [Deltaproteobacteria bacterium]|nr:MAG: metallophosphoesterase [Deltaproteobacteria bacterium]